jgi:hypothetical protein
MSGTAEPAASREDLLALVVMLCEQNASLAGRCALLEAQNEQLTARVAELERRLNRNSNNSNFPSSQDAFGLPKDEEDDEAKAHWARRETSSAFYCSMHPRSCDFEHPGDAVDYRRAQTALYLRIFSRLWVDWTRRW